MTLGEQQRLFAKLSAQFILWIYDQGYEVTYGEAFRTAQQAALNAQSGSGIANSLHTQRLALDLNLFKDGVWLQDTSAWEALGEYWESLHPLCRWGGRFSKPDGNHISMEYAGVK